MKDVITNLLLTFLLSAFLVKDKPSSTVEKINKIPSIILWAWERPEDLRFINPRETAVAYYAGIIHLKEGWASFHPRMNPLKVNPGTILFPVFRIEELNCSEKGPDPESIERAVKIVSAYAKHHASPVVQIDYDAVLSSRTAYVQLLKDLRKSLPEGTSISVTALASWCLDDKWLGKTSVDESVAMLFSMGMETKLTLAELSKKELFAGTNIQSLGASADAHITNRKLKELHAVQKSKHIYMFNHLPWTPASFARCKAELI